MHAACSSSRGAAERYFTASMTLSSTDFQGKMDLVYCWKTNIISARGAVTASPPRRTLPEVADDSPAMIWSSVDLPQPEGPISATKSPRSTEKETFSNADRPCALKRLLRLATSTKAA